MTATVAWRPMMDGPTRTGRYIVAHCGHVGGDAFYVHPQDAPFGHLGRAGWHQLPDFGATHWCEGPPSGPDWLPRYWPPPKPPKPPKPERVSLRRVILAVSAQAAGFWLAVSVAPALCWLPILAGAAVSAYLFAPRPNGRAR